MRSLFVAMALVEIGTGLAVLTVPSLISSWLLGAALESAAALVIARIAGVALLSLGIACWLARPAGTGILTAMLVYNTGAAAVLTYARIGYGLAGIFLWPAVIVHALLAIWCIAGFRAVRH